MTTLTVAASAQAPSRLEVNGQLLLACTILGFAAAILGLASVALMTQSVALLVGAGLVTISAAWFGTYQALNLPHEQA